MALAVATATATGTSASVCGAEATAPKPNTRKIGPGGCQSCAAETSDPSTANTVAAPTATHARDSSEPTSTPAATAATSRVPAVNCMVALERWTWLRP